MAELDHELYQVYLQPGEFHLARSPAVLKTILGSCVGVTFWSRACGLGALCHGVLPVQPKRTAGNDGYRYVDFAIRNLIRQFEGLGAKRADVQIKVFGGADVLPVRKLGLVRKTVGQQNFHTALDVLRQENLTVAASDVGGLVGRTIEFNTMTGVVLVRRLTQNTVSLGADDE